MQFSSLLQYSAVKGRAVQCIAVRFGLVQSNEIRLDQPFLFIFSHLLSYVECVGLPKGQTKPPKPDICSEYNFDAVMYYPRTRNTYFFKENKVWVMNARKHVGNHEIISDKWPGLEGYLDAAYTRKDGDIIFFKGNR